MYSDLCTYVKVDNKTCTESFKCNIGKRQGCKPLLFNLFIDELIEDLRLAGIKGVQISNDISDILAILYTDDIVNVSYTVKALQAQIDIIAAFCNRTGIRINLSKTKIIVFRNGGIIKDNEKWFFNGQRLETVSAYKYMGIFVTPKLIWTSAKEGSAVQAKKAILTMSKLQHAVGYFDFVEYFKLF